MKKKRGARPGGGGSRTLGRTGVWREDDPWSGLDRTMAPVHGTVGPAKRGFACDGRCWDPNRYGACRVCGGTDPLQRGAGR